MYHGTFNFVEVSGNVYCLVLVGGGGNGGGGGGGGCGALPTSSQLSPPVKNIKCTLKHK